MNRKIIEATRSMSHHAKLPLQFWAEAVNTAVYLAVYLQNRISERLNRKIIEATRSMIHHAKLPLQFWAEAVNTAVYLAVYLQNGIS